MQATKRERMAKAEQRGHRGRFIAPSTELSAPSGFPDIPMKKLMCIIGPRCIDRFPDDFVKHQYRPPSKPSLILHLIEEVRPTGRFPWADKSALDTVNRPLRPS